MELPDATPRHERNTPRREPLWRLDRVGFFRNLDEKRLKRDAFRSVPQLIDAIMGYIENHNDDPKPIVWTKAADAILEKVGRARAKLEKSATA